MPRDLWANALRVSFLLGFFLQPCYVFGRADAVLSVKQYYNLTNEEAREGPKIRIEGTVLYSDPGFGLLWIQDETGRLFVPVTDEHQVPPARSTAVITGKIELVEGSPKIVDFRIRKSGRAELPPPKMLTPLNIQGKKQEDSRVLGAGTVIQAQMKDDDHIRLVIAFLRRFQFRVTINNCQPRDLDGLLGSHIEVIGCATRFSNVNHPELAPMQMFVPDMTDVAIFQRGPADLYEVPQIRISEAPFEYQSRRDPRLVRITGKLESQPDTKTIVLTDGEADLTVRLREEPKLSIGSRVEVVGIVWKEEGQDKFFLDSAIARVSVTSAENVNSSANDSESNTELPVLHTVQSVRGLTPEMAAKKYPVEIRGVVTYYDPVWRVLFVSDETGGIYVNEKSQGLPIQTGDRVVVRGVSNQGGFSSMIEASRVQHVAKGQLPDPRTVPASRILSGAEDSQWLTVTATVRSVERSQKNLILNLQGIQKNYPFQAVICSAAKHLTTRNWIGSQIELTGVCGTKANANRQATGVYFHIPSLDYVEFLEEAADDLFAIPQVAIADLLKFTPKASDERLQQVKISGVVTYSGANGQVSVQDSERGILLRIKSTQRPEIGDYVDVIGYPVLNSTQRMQAADWQKTGSAEMPSSLPINVAEIVDRSNDGQFVSLEALLLRNNSDSVSPGLTLQSDGIVFSADLSSTRPDDQWAKLRDGSTIRLEGVLEVADDGWGESRSFRLLCPSIGKVELLRRAPLWNSAMARMLVFGLAVLVLGSVLWVITLRRSLNRKREQIKTELVARANLTEQYNRLIDNARELIFSVRPNGEFVEVNPATERVLKSTNSDLHGEQLSQFLTRESTQAFNDSIVQLSAEHSRAELELSTKDNVILEAAIYLQGETSGENQIQCIARDVSERRRLEHQIRHMQKMESIGQLAAGIAHDYNNLMTVVLCNCEILLECGELSPEDGDAVWQIKDAAERAASLTRQLLAFSRRQIMCMTIFQPKEMLAGLKEMLQRLIGESIHLQCDFGKELQYIHADRGMLEQVIINLAVNARDAMPQGGMLSFALHKHENSPDSESHNINLSAGEYVQISVTDTGCGIPSDEIPNIFEPFYTSKDVGKGTGLGLSTAFGIIRQHKGWIDVNSQIDVGTTFSILLPIASEDSSTQEETSEYPDKTTLSSGMETIMVVEDDRDVRKTVTNLLTIAGYDIVEANNGIDALETWHKLKNQIDMIITDMIMPGGLSGYEMAQEIKSVAPDTRLIYCSGYSHEITKLSTLDATERLLPKPYETKALLQLVRELLDLNAPVKS